MKESVYDRLDTWIDYCEHQCIDIKRLLIHPNDMTFLRREGGVKGLVTYRGYPVESMKRSIPSNKKMLDLMLPTNH